MIRRRVRLGVVTILVAVGALAMFAGQALAKPGAYKVLFVYGIDPTSFCSTNALQNQIAAMPGVSIVSGFNGFGGTPSTSMLDQYDMVVTFSDCGGYKDGTTLGNNLANYADQGGVVVEFPYAMENGSNGIAGRWLTGGYNPLVPGTNPNNNVTLAGFDASSPLMKGVGSLSANCNTPGVLSPGAKSVALWNTGQEAVAFKGQGVAINAAMDASCSASGNYARLTLNAVTWRGRHYLKVKKTGKGSGRVKSSPHGIKCGKACKAIYNFDQVVTLKAKGTKGSKFAGWGGACHGHKKTCTVTMSAAKKVKAKFKK